MVTMVVDHRHDVMSLKRLVDGSWQLWCGCRHIFTDVTLASVTASHSEHVINEHHKEVYGEEAGHERPV